MSRNCPTCQQPWPTGKVKRMCILCGKAIGARHKWNLAANGLVHKDCANPTGKVEPKPPMFPEATCPKV